MDYAFNDATTEMVSKTGETTILLPLIKLKKRVMLDNFDIKSNDDRHVPLLLRAETNGLIAWIITNLFRVAFIATSPDEVGRELTEAEETLRWSLIKLACRVDYVDAA